MLNVAKDLTKTEQISALRWEWQTRIGIYAVNLWTLDEETASELLSKHSVAALLTAMSQVSKELRHLREELHFLSEQEALTMFEEAIEQVGGRMKEQASFAHARREANRKTSLQAA